MDRRTFVRSLVRSLAAGSVVLSAPACVRQALMASPDQEAFLPDPSSLLSGEHGGGRLPPELAFDDFIKDYLHKMRNFDQPHENDVVLDQREFALLESSVRRLTMIQEMVGHGNFYLLSFDEALQAAKQFASVGPFSRAETDFLESVFYTDASRYGFMGEKPLADLTRPLDKQDILKIPYTGNWLYRGEAQKSYDAIKAALGDRVILTSGVRSIVKQFMLFLNKALDNQGNLSLASRSLAPPGYSFHGVGDFDVGKKGLGADNFTAEFTNTDVFKELADRGFITLRYPRDNMLGVRFEPWHIKVERS